MENERQYIAIDLKSFYASVECADRGLDPLTTNLVVADISRTEKTICLAVSPSLKSYGISGRARLYEVIQRVNEINEKRKKLSPSHTLLKGVYDNKRVIDDPFVALDYIVAPPRMKKYMDVSTKVYKTYLKFISSEDIHVYSIDEVFIDVTGYLKIYKMTPKEIAMMLIKEVLKETGITATAGVGTNLYLAKIAMDIVAKHIDPDENGVRIAQLNEMEYRRTLWNHKPITDFWRVGRGYEKKLNENGMYTMGDIARASVAPAKEYKSEELLYMLFGVNAELLIDHAWGWESVTMKDIKSYRPLTKSLSSGQVLHTPYEYEKAKMVMREMAESLSLDLVDKKLCCSQLVFTVGYDRENISKNDNNCEIGTDYYGRKVPKPSHGTVNLDRRTSSMTLFLEATEKFFSENVNKSLTIRRLGIAACHVESEDFIEKKEPVYEQLNMFTDYKKLDEEKEKEELKFKKERNRQEAMLKIQKMYGKNAIVKGTDLTEGATKIERNSQIGGHKA